jgi:hypothetical protein
MAASFEISSDNARSKTVLLHPQVDLDQRNYRLLAMTDAGLEVCLLLRDVAKRVLRRKS